MSDESYEAEFLEICRSHILPRLVAVKAGVDRKGSDWYEKLKRNIEKRIILLIDALRPLIPADPLKRKRLFSELAATLGRAQLYDPPDWTKDIRGIKTALRALRPVQNKGSLWLDYHPGFTEAVNKLTEVQEQLERVEGFRTASAVKRKQGQRHDRIENEGLTALNKLFTRLISNAEKNNQAVKYSIRDPKELFWHRKGARTAAQLSARRLIVICAYAFYKNITEKAVFDRLSKARTKS